MPGGQDRGWPAGHVKMRSCLWVSLPSLEVCKGRLREHSLGLLFEDQCARATSHGSVGAGGVNQSRLEDL